MRKKDNTILWVVGAVAVGWFLAPKALKEQITGGVPGIGIDLSGLLGGGVGQAPLGLGGLMPELDFPAWEFPPFPETPLLDYSGIIQDILDAGNTAADVVGKAEAAAADAATGGAEAGDPNVAPTPPPAPKGTWEWMMDEFSELHPLTKNVLAGVTGVGGGYGVFKTVQALAPGVRPVSTAMGNVVANALKGKPPVSKVPKVTGFTKPPGVKPNLWKQWLRYSSLGKGGQVGRVGVGLLGKTTLATLLTIPTWEAAKWINSLLGGGTSGVTIFLDQFMGIPRLSVEAADVTLPRSIPMVESMGNVVNRTEGSYTPNEAPPESESKYTPIIYKRGLPDI